jgi:hypothetical protein
MAPLKQEKKCNCGMYQLVDGHNFDISLSLFLSALLLFSKKTQNSATVFEVRHGKLRKKTTQGKVLQTISKFFWESCSVYFFIEGMESILEVRVKLLGKDHFLAFVRSLRKKKVDPLKVT